MQTPTDTPGRNCPLHYRYPALVFERAPELQAELLYVVGGLYGNLQAWQAFERLLETERAAANGSRARIAVVLNGDFHWFDGPPNRVSSTKNTRLSRLARVMRCCGR